MVAAVTDARIVEPTAPRMLPALDERNRAFWTGGARGELLLQRCEDCQRWVHPQRATCLGCDGPLVDRAVSGRGTVFTFTVNEQPFHPDVPPPYTIAIVELVEQADLRLPTNLVGCEPGEIAIGMPVRVVFEAAGEHHVPLFEPDR